MKKRADMIKICFRIFLGLCLPGLLASCGPASGPAEYMQSAAYVQEIKAPVDCLVAYDNIMRGVESEWNQSALFGLGGGSESVRDGENFCGEITLYSGLSSSFAAYITIEKVFFMDESRITLYFPHASEASYDIFARVSNWAEGRYGADEMD